MSRAEAGGSEIFQGASGMDFGNDPNVSEASQNPTEGQSLAKMKNQLAELDRQLGSAIFDKRAELPHLEALYQRTSERRDALHAQVSEIEDRPRLEAEQAEKTRKREVVEAIRVKMLKRTGFLAKLKNTPEPAPYKSSEDRNFIETELEKINEIIPVLTEGIVEHSSLRSGFAQEMEQKIRNYEQTRQAYYEDLMAVEEKEMIADIRSEIAHVLSVGDMTTELGRLILTNETIDNLIARGYRPGAGESNVEILLPVIQGKLSAAEEVVQHYFPGLKIDQSGEPVVGFIGRLFGKDKKIKNHEDYRIFRAIFDLKNHLEAEPATILPEPEPEPVAVKVPTKTKRTSPILRYATMAATGAALVSDQDPNFSVQARVNEEMTTIAQREAEDENQRPAGMPEFIIAPKAERAPLETEGQAQDRRSAEATPLEAAPEEMAEAQGRRDIQLAAQTEESASSRSRRDLDESIDTKSAVIAKQAVREKNPLKNTLVGAIEGSTFKNIERKVKKTAGGPKTSPETQAQINSAFAGAEDYEPDMDDAGSIFEQGPARPSMETQPARVTEVGKKKLDPKVEKIIKTAIPGTSKKTQAAMAEAFTGGQKLDQETPDEKRFRFEPKTPTKKSQPAKITAAEFTENMRRSADPSRSLDHEAAEEEETTKEASLETTEAKKAEYLTIPEEFRAIGKSELDAYRNALTPPVYNSLFRRLQKLGFSGQEQNKILNHMVKVTDSMTPELRAKKVNQALKLDHKGFKKTFKQAFLD